MSMKLFISAIAKFLLGVLLVGLLVILPAGTFNYVNGWILMTVLFVPMFIAGIVMMLKNPNLLAKRLDAKEKVKTQSTVIKLSGLMFVGGFVLAGLDYRYGWLKLPFTVTIISTLVFILGYILYGFVLVQNTYLSRTIEVVEDQKVIDSGLYGLVRHPMYFATLLLFLSIPLILGSLYAFFVFLLYIPIIVVRLLNEEKVLEKELNGYADYMKKVKYRLIPFIW